MAIILADVTDSTTLVVSVPALPGNEEAELLMVTVTNSEAEQVASATHSVHGSADRIQLGGPSVINSFRADIVEFRGPKLFEGDVTIVMTGATTDHSVAAWSLTTDEPNHGVILLRQGNINSRASVNGVTLPSVEGIEFTGQDFTGILGSHSMISHMQMATDFVWFVDPAGDGTEVFNQSPTRISKGQYAINADPFFDVTFLWETIPVTVDDFAGVDFEVATLSRAVDLELPGVPGFSAPFSLFTSPYSLTKAGVEIDQRLRRTRIL